MKYSRKEKGGSMYRISKNMFLYCILGTLCVGSIVSAQYNEIWHSPADTRHYIGCENTDNDNAKECVFIRVSASMSYYQIRVIDGITGTLEWELPPYWYFIATDSNTYNAFYPRLIDVDGDDRYEILFYGQPNSGDSLRWYLYGYTTYIEEGQGLIKQYQDIQLSQSFPNPAKTFTTIEYSLTKRAEVVLKIYNSAGQLVRSYHDGIKDPGTYALQWDCRDEKGTELPCGSYFYQLIIDDQQKTKKLVNIE